jgi:hypothetical protein
VVVASTIAAPNARQARVSCHARALTFLFWPNGHNAIPSVNFPSFPYPHLEVYKTANTYVDQNFMAGIGFGSTGQPYGGFAQSCTKVKSKLINSKGATARTDQATLLQCTFPKPAQMEVAKAQATPVTETLRAVVPSKSRTVPLAVSASMTDQPGGSTLRYNPNYCKAYPPPQ